MYIKERISYYCMYLILACVNNFAKLNGISRVALKAISWASGVELNYTKKR